MAVIKKTIRVMRGESGSITAKHRPKPIHKHIGEYTIISL